ncbi:lysoplasmalogenase-like protein TMEM86A [Acipenser ruthenus]|uniref:lysoplasmalogenase-like protein TMEM86A n=1 Tax=Acipenser ruthenus TaxID=7906 RepID=UPI00145AB568|nr:lysoplasmalogenase-like protein TMEM86A [Acipenser ruthenus]XP_058876880.1 lysoplasmalogenase-like protein TMEM86A [Acipenser ruthenus]
MDILETQAYCRRKERRTLAELVTSLLPFFVSSSTYFYLWLPDSSPSPFSAAVKSAPVLSLAGLVWYHKGGRSLCGSTGAVLAGLLLSAAGDVCLIWKELFLPGMLFFALAHICYSLSFSSRSSPRSRLSPSLLLLSLSLWVFAGLSLLYFLPHLSVRKDSSVITPAVCVYTFLIAMMANLALVTSRPLTMAGALFFMISDLTLACHTFVAPLPWGRAAVMTTYYLAQALIAVGGVREGSDVVADGLGNRKRK